MKAHYTRHGYIRSGMKSLSLMALALALALSASPAMAAKFTIQNCGTTDISVHTSAPESGKKHAKNVLPNSTEQITCANETCNLTFKVESACPSDKSFPNRTPDTYLVRYGYIRDASGNCSAQWDFRRGDDCAQLPTP